MRRRKNIVSSPLEMRCSSMVKKRKFIDDYHEMLDILKTLPNEGKKPTLLLHACCGPCATYPLFFLHKYFDITIGYANSNIYPSSEFEKRKATILEMLDKFNEEYHTSIKIIFFPYEHDSYMRDLTPYEADKEGGPRCKLCYEKRMDEVFKYADDHHYDYFTTVMSVSRYKPTKILNEIGERLDEKYVHTQYLLSDFKRGGGIKIDKEMTRRYALYEQNYCGCEYSLNDREKFSH